MTTLTIIPGAGEGRDEASDILAVVDDCIVPAVDGLRASATAGDLVQARTYALELIALAGCVAGACPSAGRW